jgi:hypothetical protein
VIGGYPQYTLTVNRHDGPHNYLRINRPNGETLIDITDREISMADPMEPDETQMVIRVLSEHVRQLYRSQEKEG